MSDSIKIAANEAQVLSKYLIGERCSEQTVQHYAVAVEKLHASLTPAQQHIWDSMISFRPYLKLVDSGLAVTNAQSPLRKRIFIMLTLLEASPDHVRYFLPQERSICYLIPLGFRAGVSALLMLTGAVTVKLSGIAKA